MTDSLALDNTREPDPLDGHINSQTRNDSLPKKSTKASGKRAEPKKTIKAFGLTALRTAQACDRCRAKKSRCDGKQPTCSSCAAAGMECVVSDRLTRKSYPKGYTELLEQQSRQLLAENARLKGALDSRDEQLASYTGKLAASGTKTEPAGAGNTFLLRKSTSPERLDPDSLKTKLHESHTNHESGCICCHGSPAVHERPVYVAGFMDGDDAYLQGNVYYDFDGDSVDDGNFDLASTNGDDMYAGEAAAGVGFYNQQIRPAPGAFAAATAIEQMHNERRHTGTNVGKPGNSGSGSGDSGMEAESTAQMLTSLVAAAIPRSTEETLFVPTVLARVGEAYGYNSAPAKLTAGALASLKESSILAIRHNALVSGTSPTEVVAQIMANVPSPGPSPGDDSETHVFLKLLGLPPREHLDSLMNVFFEHWGRVVPIVNRSAYLRQYARFCDMLEHGSSQRPLEFGYELNAQLGAITVCAVALAMLLKKADHTKGDNSSPEAAAELARYVARLAQFDVLIHAFVLPSCALTQACSLASLRIVALALQYCLATGDHAACHELRGRAVTMAQQMRLHRCPAAVLGLARERSDRTFQAFMQGERRVVFWCIYVLDTYASLSLGVPRLLKDYEIECATPFSGSTDDDLGGAMDENIVVVNNTKLTIFGKVARIALCVMQFCKVLGNITDLIFSRSGNFNVHERALEKHQILDSWRRDLPAEFKFEVEVDGFTFKEGDRVGPETHRSLLVFLYYHAKTLIYLPIISKYGNHHNVGLSAKEQLALGHNDVLLTVASMTLIQQSAVQILKLIKNLAESAPYLLPLPVNILREHARFSILAAMGALDFIKGGPLHMQLKQLLLDTIPLLKQESALEIPSSLTKKSTSLLEYAILSILGLNQGRTAGSNGTNALRRRIINNESMAKAESLQNPANSANFSEPLNHNTSFEVDASFDVPMMTNVSQTQGNKQQTFPQQSTMNGQSSEVSNGFDRSSAFTGTIPGSMNANLHSSSMDMDQTMVKLSFSPYGKQPPVPIKEESQDGLIFDGGSSIYDENADFFKFDELIKNFSNDMLSGEFVTDGSLGLVPFLNEPNEYTQGGLQNEDPYSTEY